MSAGLNDDETSDQEAMARLARGDDLAMNDIMDRWTPRLAAYLSRLLASQNDAADLVQETFVAVYRARLRYRPTAKYSSWIFAIANNLARQRLRWRKRHPEVALELEIQEGSCAESHRSSENPSRNIQEKEIAAAVRSAILSLPTELREAIILRVYEGLPQTEIAHILGCSPKAVETRIYRARQLLRERLQAHL